MKKLVLTVVASAAVLTGCASGNEYRLYAETQQRIAQAQAQAHAAAEAARYAALAEIAKNGDATARVAAAMSLSLGGNAGTGQNGLRQVPVNPPVSTADKALQWTSILLPSLTQFYGISANRQVAVTQSNNQLAAAQSNNAMMTSVVTAGHTANTAIANSGLTAVTTTAANGLTATQNVATAGLTATQNVATAGMTGIVTTAANGLTAATTISTNANTAITNVSNAANTSIQTIANTIPNLQPNVTTTTTSTTTTNNQCGSNASGGTVTCP